MSTYLNIAQILVSIALMTVLLLQARNSGGLGGIFGSDTGGFFRTRRGVEKLLFNLTIFLGVVFLAISLASAVLAKL